MFVAVAERQQFGSHSRTEVEAWASRHVLEAPGREVNIYNFSTERNGAGRKGLLVGVFQSPAQEPAR